jgi:ABC-type polysaccharide/polyol phosphate transport system ATPase subunit
VSAPAVEARAVTKVYRRYSRRRQFATLKSALLSRSFIRDLKPDDAFEALKGVSFNVATGRTLGVVGRNGSGKSTLLKLVAGIGKPTSGDLTVRGRVSALIELGAGFHPEISGRENVFINGLMLGLTRREISRRFDEIVAFAELAPFIDAPVKTYSSGMYMRLGFSVAIHVDPDVLLVDEVLAVGDEAFTHKCLDKFAEFRQRGRTTVLVTHSLDLVERFCDEALWLDGGLVREQGNPRRVIDEYRLDVAREEDARLTAAAVPAATGQDRETEKEPKPESGAQEEPSQAADGRWGSREVEIVRVDLEDAAGRSTHLFASGARMCIRIGVEAHQPVTDFVFGVGIFDANGICCFGTNTLIEGGTPESLESRADIEFVVDTLDLTAGSYKLDVAVHRTNGAPYDYHRQMYEFKVTSPIADVGIYRPRHHWRFSGGVRLTGLP